MTKSASSVAISGRGRAPYGDRQAVEFGVEIGEYRGVMTVPRRVFQRLLSERPTPATPPPPGAPHRLRDRLPIFTL